MAVTSTGYKTSCEPPRDTPSLGLTDELCGVFCEDLYEKWLWHKACHQKIRLLCKNVLYQRVRSDRSQTESDEDDNLHGSERQVWAKSVEVDDR